MVKENVEEGCQGKPGRRPKAREPIPDLSVEEWHAEMTRLMDAPATPERGERLYRVTTQLDSHARSMVHQPHTVRRVAEVALRLQQIGGPVSNHAQREILRSLNFLASDCRATLMWLDLPRQKTIADLLQAVPLVDKPCAEVLGILHDFAYACLRLVKPRDPFTSERKGEALCILGQMADLVELPEALTFVRQALTKSNAAAMGALEFLELYYARLKNVKPKVALDEELKKILFAVIAKSAARHVVAGCLLILMNTKVMSEFEAGAILRDWRDLHDV